ncbi:MAG: hypothetical protein RLZZ602_1725 [Pseudomonadota bacterium]
MGSEERHHTGKSIEHRNIENVVEYPAYKHHKTNSRSFDNPASLAAFFAFYCRQKIAALKK